MFKMFPHVEAFWKNARMAEIAELATQKAKEAMMKEQNNNSILEEIKEEENDFENKRGKTHFQMVNTSIFIESTYSITNRNTG